MNPLAAELNSALSGTVVARLLSDFGRRIFFPKGIVAQSSEAAGRATRFNATVGMAYSHGEPIMLPSLKKQLDQLQPKEAVAYSPTGGNPSIREIWKGEMVRKNPTLKGVATSLPLVVPGLTNGIFQAACLFADPGDVVLIPDMFWGNYRLIFEEQRLAKVEGFPFFVDPPGNGAEQLNVAALEKSLQDNADRGKIILLLNFPNNPTGYSPSKREAARIVEAVRRTAEGGCDVLVITDDAYFGLFYEEDTYPESLFAPLANLHERVLAVKVDGATKEEFVWGFRVGFMTFASRSLGKSHYAAIEKKLMGAVRSSISNSSTVAQSLLIHAMQSPTYQDEKLRDFEDLRGRYRRVKEICGRVERSTKALLPLPFNSGYFMSFRCSGVSAEAVRLALLDEGIGVISIQDTFLRVAFSSIDESDLEELFGAIFQAANRLARR